MSLDQEAPLTIQDLREFRRRVEAGEVRMVLLHYSFDTTVDLLPRADDPTVLLHYSFGPTVDLLPRADDPTRGPDSQDHSHYVTSGEARAQMDEIDRIIAEAAS